MPASHTEDSYLGAALRQQTVEREWLTRIYLDSAATSLAAYPVQQALQRFMGYYGSSHSDGHLAASMSLEAIAWSKARILSFLGASPDDYDVVFTGSGATTAINRLAAGLAALRGERDTVLVSLMEHHSNDLPHRQHSPGVLHIPVSAGTGWRLDPDMVDAMLRANPGRVNYVALTAASNVTGLLNPVHEITAIAHRHGVSVVVDGAQVYAHHPFTLCDPRHAGIDFFVFSGHKAHAPGSPGVLIARKSLLQRMPPIFLGGGMVDDVSNHDFTVSPNNERKEHAGTPNITGALAIGVATTFLDKKGMARIAAHEQELRRRFLIGASRDGRIRCFATQGAGEKDSLGIVSFNLPGIPHALAGAFLNDYHAIAVRSGCFCAHPYVKALLFDDFLAMSDGNDVEDHKGMVRISLAPHNTAAEIDALLCALGNLQDNRQEIVDQYLRTGSGFRHRAADDPCARFADFVAQAMA